MYNVHVHVHVYMYNIIIVIIFQLIYRGDITTPNNNTTYIHEPVITCCYDNITDIAVDWWGRNLYWTDGAAGVVGVAKLSGRSQQVLIDGLTNPLHVVLDPYERYTYIHTYIHHTKIHTYICIYKYIHYIHAYMHTHTYMYTYIHVYIHTCIHTYIHTYIHTQCSAQDI